MNFTSFDVARWMVEELKKNNYLCQREAVDYIENNYGSAFIYINENGNPAISKEVLKEFKLLHKGQAVWDKSEFVWNWDN